ncbi:MAG TPA: secretin N-terminal domain-containing protein [Opitutaceae bacterium]|nr:secretin N-terminal domain-containing protein [Opitutaceae bacterium]
MKTLHFTPTAWFGLVAITTAAWAQDAAPAATSPATPAAPAATAPAAPATATPEAPRPAGTLRFNFRGAPLETVLNYMSEAAGFIIVLDTPVRGTVDMMSAQPVTREEAVQLLNFALNKNGYASVVQGRTIVISSKDDAKKKNLPIRTGNDPEEIPNTAEMVMQIIPLRHIDATTTARDLGTLLPGTSTITANVDSNSLVITDTNINLKHVVELVSALDTSSDTVSSMRIFKLKNADPYEMAQLLTSLYSTTGTANQQAGRNGQNAFGGGGRGAAFGANGFGGGGLGGAAAIFGGAFGGANGFGGRGGAAGGGGRNGRGGTTSGARAVPVVAVADPRTFSVIVTASKDQMPDIAEMVAQLDASPARKQKVYVYTMENADVKQVETTLRNLFQTSNARTTTNNQPDALTTRATANAQTAATTNLQLGTNTSTAGGRGN